MSDTLTTEASPTLDGGLDKLLNQHFGGKVVRKDLTKLIKEGANVPVYVLEYLLGMYCASDDAATIETILFVTDRMLQRRMIEREAKAFAGVVFPTGRYCFVFLNRWDYSPRVFAMISSATLRGTSA